MALTHSPDPALGAPAPDFLLPDVEGASWSLERCRGPRGLVVMFICRHCPYVQALRDRLVSDMADLAALGVGVVAIASNDFSRYPEDAPDKLREQAREWGFGFPYLIDADQTVARAYGAVCTPDFFGFDAELRLRYRGRLDAAGRNPREATTRRELVEAMSALARGGEVSFEQQPSIGCSIKWRP